MSEGCKLLDSRRLTGPNLIWECPGAVIDVEFGQNEPQQVITEWQRQVRRMLEALDWSAEETCVRQFPNGASLAISAPLDQLYLATDVNEWAWDAACRIFESDDPEPPLEHDAKRFRGYREEDANPRQLELVDAARIHRLPALCDTDALSIGLGTGSRTWPLEALPSPDSVPWNSLHTIPVSIVTGTNGKTSSVRMASAVGKAAGYTVGVCSTDWIAVDGSIIEEGDFAGPGGARTVLRHPSVDFAVLETARGGLLRRGLAVETANAVLITNIGSDHLGEFGVQNVDELADVKWIVTRAVRRSGQLILNADDPRLVQRGQNTDFNISWFSLDPGNPVMREGLDRPGNAGCTLVEGDIVYLREGQAETVVAVNDIPITLGGAARYQTSNALGVVALCAALGLKSCDIAAGLRAMQPQDNPGRANAFRIGGTTVIVDFAHNPEGTAALMDLSQRLPAKRRLLLLGQAGDRGDEEIRGLVRSALQCNLDRIIVKQMRRYNRGRADGEVAGILLDELQRHGFPKERIEVHEDELGAIEAALAWCEAGDLLIFPIHESRQTVLDFLAARSGHAAV